MNTHDDEITVSDDELIEIDSVDEIPIFANEDEEAEFWATHGFSEELWARLPPTPEELLPPIREPSVRRDS